MDGIRMNTQPFIHNNRGKGRPQVLLIGNGLERGENGQPEWSKLLDALAAPGRKGHAGRNRPESAIRDRLLEAHGVRLNPFGVKKQADYPTFYNMAMDAIAEQIQNNKG